MDAWLVRLATVASKVQTPLGLAGVALVILYAIANQILKLNVFDNIGGNATFVLLDNIFSRIFYLALLSILLAVASYLVTLQLNTRPAAKQSSLRLVDASLDGKHSTYVAGDDGKGGEVIRRRQPISSTQDASGAPPSLKE
jgi:hypothetical protein